MVPAILCVVVGALLGVWGAGDREDSRTRIIEQGGGRDQDDDGGGLFDPEPVGDAYLQARAGSCQALFLASDLRLPESGPGVLDPSDAEEQARSLTYLLGPQVVAGIPGLDVPEVHAAIEALRSELRGALDEGADPRQDPGVQAAADELGRVASERC